MGIRFYFFKKMAVFFPLKAGISSWNTGAYLNNSKEFNKTHTYPKWHVLWLRLGWMYFSMEIAK